MESKAAHGRSAKTKLKLSWIHKTGIVVGIVSLPIAIFGLIVGPRDKARPAATGLATPASQQDVKLKAEAMERTRAEQAAANGGVWIGMSRHEAESSPWGKPTSISTSTYSFGVHEQWAYPDYKYLYFQNGALTSIQKLR